MAGTSRTSPNSTSRSGDPATRSISDSSALGSSISASSMSDTQNRSARS